MSSTADPQLPDHHDVPSRARPLIEAGAEAERKGRSAEARALYERALRSLDRDEAALQAASLARWIARCHAAEGDVEAAMDSAELGLSIAEAHGDAHGVAHALNGLGALSQQRGDLDAAVVHYRAAEERARSAGNARLAAMVQLNLGTIANIHGDFAGALARYEQALAGFRECGAEDQIGFVLNNLGMLHTDQGKWAAAERAFDGALQALERGGSVVVKVMVLTNLAELYVSTLRTDAAERLCEDAWVLVRDIADRRAEGELCRVHGIVLRERGDLDRAEQRLQRAALLAEEREDLLLAAEVLREQAVLSSLQDRSQETLQRLNRSHRLFWQLRARRDIADLSGRIQTLEETFLSIVRRWGESIESADVYTQGHCVRVADYACALARAAGFDEQTLLWFRMGALLHDVGKIAIPPEVLNKPDGYTPQERMLMERHPEAGVELLAELEFPWDIRPMIRFHHERWSGGGYPTGVSGEAIPEAARILSIADVFDALTSDRPYRAAFGMREALELMDTNLRPHFDPRLLDRWIELCRSGEVRLLDGDARDGGGVAPTGPLPTVLLVGEQYGAAELAGVARRWEGRARFLLAHGWADAQTIAAGEAVLAVVVGVRGQRAAALSSIGHARDTFPDLPVVALLDRDDEELSLRLLQYGAQDCLVRHALDPFLFGRALRRAVARGRVQSALHGQSLRDDLTGLYNRRGFFSVGARRVRALAAGGQPTVLFLDFDGLKPINDEFGHVQGDRALVEMADALRAVFPATDVVARLGGAEFAVLTSTPSAAEPDALAERLEAALARGSEASRRPRPLSVSVGAAPVDQADEATIAQALYRADREMYGRRRDRDVRSA